MPHILLYAIIEIGKLYLDVLKSKIVHNDENIRCMLHVNFS